MEYYRELGIYDLYRRAVAIPPEPAVETDQAANAETIPTKEIIPLTMSKKIESLDLPIFSLDPSSNAGRLAAIDVENKPTALKAIREATADYPPPPHPQKRRPHTSLS